MAIPQDIELPSGKKRDLFSAPIPGQSLTSTPGSAPYEKPARFNTPDEAMDFYMSRLQNDSVVYPLIAALEAGVPVKRIVQSMVMQGVGEGLYTPDVSLLILEDLSMLLVAIAKETGITPVSGVEGKVEEEMQQIVESLERRGEREQGFKAAIQKVTNKNIEEEEKPVETVSGLMSKVEEV